MTFRETVEDYETADRAKMPASGQAYAAAMRLPQTEARAVHVAQADGVVRAGHAAMQWLAGVEDAAHALRVLVIIHDNGGTASSPEKIKNAARELLRLLGED